MKIIPFLSHLYSKMLEIHKRLLVAQEFHVKIHIISNVQVVRHHLIFVKIYLKDIIVGKYYSQIIMEQIYIN